MYLIENKEVTLSHKPNR